MRGGAESLACIRLGRPEQGAERFSHIHCLAKRASWLNLITGSGETIVLIGTSQHVQSDVAADLASALGACFSNGLLWAASLAFFLSMTCGELRSR